MPPQTKSSHFLKRQLLIHTKINNENMFKLAYRDQCLKKMASNLMCQIPHEF